MIVCCANQTTPHQTESKRNADRVATMSFYVACVAVSQQPLFTYVCMHACYDECTNAYGGHFCNCVSMCTLYVVYFTCFTFLSSIRRLVFFTCFARSHFGLNYNLILTCAANSKRITWPYNGPNRNKQNPNACAHNRLNELAPISKYC